MRVLTCLIVVISLAGCVTTRTINQEYQAELQQVHPGMTVAEFRTVMPQATAIRQSTNDDGHISATYEIDHRRALQDRPWWWRKKLEKVWFHFLDGRLVKWGAPEE